LAPPKSGNQLGFSKPMSLRNFMRRAVVDDAAGGRTEKAAPFTTRSNSDRPAVREASVNLTMVELSLNV
jgi:hypothetical protein